ncbi:MAG TPA: SMC-Scp complex subunit ScpB, partial [Pseudomonas sp.]|nr:SMC-Scp complex subunit ScpB [Pseudomonas sp.]
ADLAGETEDGEELQGAGEVSFRSLLAELDQMEQGLKTDFDDLLEDEIASAEAEEREDPSYDSGP